MGAATILYIFCIILEVCSYGQGSSMATPNFFHDKHIKLLPDHFASQLSSILHDKILSSMTTTTQSSHLLIRELSGTTYVSTQQEFSIALGLGSPIIELTSDITLSTGEGLYVLSDVNIIGNNFTVSGSDYGMGGPCFSVVGPAAVVSFNNMSIVRCGKLGGSYFDYGGAILGSANLSHTTVLNCQLSDNVALYGAGVFVDIHSTITLKNTVLTNNVAIIGGGALFAYGTLNAYNSKVENNVANIYGGAMSSYYATGEFDDVIIKGNQAGAELGGLSFIRGSWVIKNTIITENTASSGGGVGMFSYAEVVFISCTFSYNQAYSLGGAMAMGTMASAKFISCDIFNNLATAGGGFAINYGFVNFTDTTFRNNYANSSATFTRVSGDCVVHGGCFYSGNYPAEYAENEHCQFRPDTSGILEVKSFTTEPGLDVLTIGGIDYSGFEGPNCVNVSKGQNITWNTNALLSYPGFFICLTEFISGGGSGFLKGGSASFDSCTFKNNYATRVGSTIQLEGGDLVLNDCDISTKNYLDMAPINIDDGYLTATDLRITGDIVGGSAVISSCDSACGQGRIGNCTEASEFAPDCQVNCACIDCPAGTYSKAEGSSTDVCYDCEATYSSNAGASSCDIAAEGYYIDQDGFSQVCPNHAYCVGGLELPRPLKNHWVDRSSLHWSAVMDRCYRKTCPGYEEGDGDDDLSTSGSSCWLSQCYSNTGDDSCAGCDDDKLQCSEGARGPLCGSCEEGYSYSSSTQNCLKCQLSSIQSSDSITVMTMVFLVILVIVALVWIHQSIPESILTGVWLNLFKKFVGALRRHSNSGALRVLWANYQILDSITWTLEISFPSPLSQFLDSLHVLSFDFFIVDCLPGGYISSVLLWTLVPIGVGIANQVICYGRLFMLTRFHNQSKQTSSNKKLNSDKELKFELRKKKIISDHFGMFILLIFTLLPPVSRRQFVALNCFNYHGDSLLRIDSTVDCNSNEFQLFRLFDIVVIICFMMIPIYWVWLLHQQRNILNPQAIDEDLVYYLRDNDPELRPLRFLFVPYKPKNMYFESLEMYRRIVFVGVLPLLSNHSERRAALGVVMSLCSLELFRNVEPFRESSTNLLAYVAQYAILLTFAAALMLEAGIGDGVSNLTIGLVLLGVNISVFVVAIVAATNRFLNDQARKQVAREKGTKQIEKAYGFSNEKFQTTFDAIVQHSVPPSSCLVFWYSDEANAQQALKSGIPAVPLSSQLKKNNGRMRSMPLPRSSRLGDRSMAHRHYHGNTGVLGGVVVTLHGPSDCDDTDMKYFPNREVVFACSVPRRWLTPIIDDESIDPQSNKLKQANSFISKNDSGGGTPSTVISPVKPTSGSYLTSKGGGSGGGESDHASFESSEIGEDSMFKDEGTLESNFSFLSDNTIDSVDSLEENSKVRVISAEALRAIRGTYFGNIEDPWPWYEGSILLPPTVIHRAYQLVHDEDVTRIEDASPPAYVKDLVHSHYIENFDAPLRDSCSMPLSESMVKQGLQKQMSSAQYLKRNMIPVLTPTCCLEFCDAMRNIRNICAMNGWAPLYHYTQPMFGHMIAKTGFRMSTQGQGDGGVYFSTKSPCSYGLGTENYERNIIIDCFGEGRLNEFKGKNHLDLVIIYGGHPQILSPAPGGRDNAVMVRKSDFQALAYPHADGNYFLRPDRILGIFHLNTIYSLEGYDEAMERYKSEEDLDNQMKRWLNNVQASMANDEKNIDKIKHQIGSSNLSTTAGGSQNSLLSNSNQVASSSSFLRMSQGFSSLSFGGGGGGTGGGASLINNPINFMPTIENDSFDERRDSKSNGIELGSTYQQQDKGDSFFGGGAGGRGGGLHSKSANSLFSSFRGGGNKNKVDSPGFVRRVSELLRFSDNPLANKEFNNL